jgi:hypothetical protein
MEARFEKALNVQNTILYSNKMCLFFFLLKSPIFHCTVHYAKLM